MRNTTNTGNIPFYNINKGNIENIENTFIYQPLIETIPIIQKKIHVLTSVLTKRTYATAFTLDDNAMYDDARYGQHIADNFFTDNCGHAVYYPPKIQTNIHIPSTNIPSTNIPQTEADKPFISEEMKFYMENRNLFNV